jgi:hypothetical protein
MAIQVRRPTAPRLGKRRGFRRFSLRRAVSFAPRNAFPVICVQNFRKLRPAHASRLSDCQERRGGGELRLLAPLQKSANAATIAENRRRSSG